MNQLAAFCEREGIRTVDEFTADSPDDFRASRKIGRTTWSKELQTLRQFFKLCKKRGWIAENPTDDKKALRPESKIEPFTPKEMASILGACSEFGRRAYERLRARAMVLLLRHTGLRISDVATLRRDRIQGNEIFLHAKKNTGVVKLPLPQEVLDALAMLPPPISAPQVSQCFFWNEVTSERAVVGIAERTLAAVFKKSGVLNAHSHRFRHTLATAILERGGTEQDAADILGISPAVARKHYIHWTKNRQERISKLMAPNQPIAGTLVVQTDKEVLIQ
jgi:integrase